MQLQQWRLDMDSQALWERGKQGKQDTVRCTCSLVRTVFPTLFNRVYPFSVRFKGQTAEQQDWKQMW